jgi:hypothetical protein
MLTGILLQVRIIYLFDFLMNPETTQFDIIQSKLLQQLKKKKKKLMLIYEITILNIALINFIMKVNI